MIKTLFLGAFAAMAMLTPAQAQAAPVIGEAAPAFTGTDSNGKEHSLADYKGKIVVLEWTNHECPYVVKHYDSGNMQKLQESYTGKDVVWLTVNSGAAGKQGHRTAEQANEIIASKGAKQTAYLLDGEGVIGRAYEAKVSPHMFVIDAQGVLVYDGAIDDNDSASQDVIAASENYVAAALDALLAGNAVETSKTKPYGCGVKYKDE
ncbi:MAG: redoxin domain-containing protein [Micavibrio sp.]